MNKFAKIPEFEPGNNKVEAIRDNLVYTKEADGHLPGLYYLVLWKKYSKGYNEPLEDGQHLLQRPFKEADSDMSTLKLCFTHGQANNPASPKAKVRATDRTH